MGEGKRRGKERMRGRSVGGAERCVELYELYL